MARILFTDNLPEKLTKTETDDLYNGLDCCVTYEIFNQLDRSSPIYDFERSMLAPALEMMLRGIKVDEEKVKSLISKTKDQHERLRFIARRLTTVLDGQPIDFLKEISHHQSKRILYEKMGVRPIKKKNAHGEMAPTVNREALEKIHDENFYARPFINVVFKLRELTKRLSVLRSGIDPDGRMRFSFNVGATETGRWSSSKNPWGGGTNAQNITDELRVIFVPDEGQIFAYIDLGQAESRAVAYLAGDENYIEACESGDLHSTVAKMIWGKNVDPYETYYRYFTYRDISKRCGHATNYLGTAFSLARKLSIPIDVVAEFQVLYFKTFPDISKWQQWTLSEIQLRKQLITPLGRTRQFFGRLDDEATLREAVAYVPQSLVGDILNIGLWKVWRNEWPKVQIISQLHDAILVQFSIAQQLTTVPLLCKLLEVEIEINNRIMIIPAGAKTGFNWAEQSEENPGGLRKWTIDRATGSAE